MERGRPGSISGMQRSPRSQVRGTRAGVGGRSAQPMGGTQVKPVREERTPNVESSGRRGKFNNLKAYLNKFRQGKRF